MKIDDKCKHTADEVKNEDRSLLQTIFDGMPLPCHFCDSGHNILECNKACLGIFGLQDKREYIDGFLNLSPEYQPDGRRSREKMHDMLAVAFNVGKVRLGWIHQTQNGQPIPCEITLERVEIDGEQLAIVCVRDLRELNRALSMVEDMRRLAFTDSLTEVYNRRFFMEEAARELQSAIREDKSFSLIIADIDFFKSVNDTYGHNIGDEVLKIFAARMGNVLRDVVVARYGGEEFVVLLPGVDNVSAAAVAGRLKNNMNSDTFRTSDGAEIVVTASFGVASKTDDATVLADILINADKALYKAKELGRNMVVSYSEMDDGRL